MIIDHPEILRELIQETGAHATCKDAEKILEGKLAAGLNKSAKEWKKLCTPIWEKAEEYQKYH